MSGTVLTLLGLWALLAALWLAFYPLLTDSAVPVSSDAVRRAELETEKARLIEEIHELELDYKTGKLSEEDRAAIEHRLKARAVEVMKELETKERSRSGA